MDNPNQPNPTVPPAASMPPIPTTEEGGTPPPMPPAGVGPAPQNPGGDGSAAPSFDIPPVITTPKKKFGGGKIIATILGLLLLVGGIGAGVVLVQQRQLFQQKASTDYGTCRCYYGVITPGGSNDCTNGATPLCQGQTACICQPPVTGNCSPEGSTRSCGNCNTGTQTCQAGQWRSCTGEGCRPGAIESCANGGSRTCNSSCQWSTCSGGAGIGDCPINYCPDGDILNSPCSTTELGKCLAGGQTRYCCQKATTTTCGSSFPCGTLSCPSSCPSTQIGTSGAITLCKCTTSTSEGTCVSKGGTCMVAGIEGCSAKGMVHVDGTCLDQGNKISCCKQGDSSCSTTGCSATGCSIGTQTLSDTCFVNHYWCKTRSPGGCTSASNLIYRGVKSSNFEKDCGTEQIDVHCAACGATSIGGIAGGDQYVSKTYASDCGGGTGEISVQCLTVKVYDTNWNQLTSAQLKTLKAGDKVRFTVTGTTSAGAIDKAKFKVNGTERAEVTQKKSGTNEFYDEYTIPTGVKTFTVYGLLHHSTLGWF